jgi:hypothetical protein
VTAKVAALSAEEIAVRAQELKALHLALMMSLGSLFDPGLPILQTELRRAGVAANGDMPLNLFDGAGGPGKECLSCSSRQIMTARHTSAVTW